MKAEESQSQRPLREMISELFEHLKTQSLKSLLHKKGKEERKGCRDKKKIGNMNLYTENKNDRRTRKRSLLLKHYPLKKRKKKERKTTEWIKIKVLY